MQKRNQSYRPIDDVLKILHNFRKSGLTIKDYCSKNSINTSTFHWWLNREKRHCVRNKKKSPSFIPLGTLSPTRTDFTTVEIEYQNGTQVRLECHESLTQLTALLASLGK